MEKLIAVKLSADVDYVIGTVNGTAVTWQKTTGSVWTTLVGRSANGGYSIELEAFNENGDSTLYQTTLNYGIAAKTDWTDRDYYNYWDLNRVERSTRFLHDLLAGHGYSSEFVERGEWVMGDIPEIVEMNRYLDNIRSLLDTYSVLPTTPELPADMEDLNAIGANAIEQNLWDMYILIQNMTQAWFYCGEVYAGEV